MTGQQHVRDAGGSMAERERNVENKAVRDKDMELLNRLRESLKLSPNEHIPEEVSYSIIRMVNSTQIAPPRTSASTAPKGASTGYPGSHSSISESN